MRRSLLVTTGFAILIMPLSSFAGDCGDVNNDATINIFDITCLISYLYMDGPGPLCGETGTMTDIDGNVYQTIKIGDQWWMAENLKVTHYRNGDSIPNVTDAGEWQGLSMGAYCSYDNDEGQVSTCGRLYNWYAANDNRNIAPEGWHIPSDEEWKQMEMYLGMSQAEADGEGYRGTNEGGKLKEAGTIHWFGPNIGATNESGFTALPGGYRYTINFHDKGHYAGFWSSTENDSHDKAWWRGLYRNLANVGRGSNNKQDGFSVRCVKD